VLKILGDESAGGGLEALDGNKPEPHVINLVINLNHKFSARNEN